jgi:hypothetical protein
LPAKNEKLAIPNPGLEKVVQFCLTFPSGWTQEGTEKNAFMVWDDIDPSVFTTRPDIYRLFKFGYDRSTDTISISSDKAGKNLKFRCFCPKIFSSVSPLHTDSNFPELKRRLLTIKTKRLEDFDSSDRERMGML